MSLPPDEDPPPNSTGSRLFDANEHRVTTPPPEPFDDEPVTKVETPVPQRATLTPQEADRLMVQQALLRVATYGDTLERIEAKLGKLAEVTDALDHGIGALIRADERMDRKLDQLRSDLQLWLFGDTHRHGIAQEVGFARVRVDSIFEMLTKAQREQQGDHHSNGNGHEHAQDADGQSGRTPDST